MSSMPLGLMLADINKIELSEMVGKPGRSLTFFNHAGQHFTLAIYCTVAMQRKLDKLEPKT